MSGSDGSVRLHGGLHVGARKYFSSDWGLEVRLTLDRGGVLVPKCDKRLERCYDGEDEQTETATSFTRICGELGVPMRVGGHYTFTPPFWAGNESYDDLEPHVGRTTWNFDYKTATRGGLGARFAWSFADDRFDLGTTLRLDLVSEMHFVSWTLIELSVVL